MKHKKITIFAVLLLAACSSVFAEEEKVKSDVKWKNNLSLGSTYKSGNTEKQSYTMSINSTMNSKRHDWIGSFYGSYGETWDQQTDGQIKAKSDYRYKLIGNNAFYGGLYSEAYHNAIKDLKLRIKVGPNIGYYFIYRDSLKFDASAGTTITYERSEEETKSFGSLRLSSTYDHKISETTTYYLSAEYSISFEDSADNDGSFITGIKTRITDNLSLKAEFRDQYDNLPASSEARRNDITFTTALAYNFN